MATLKLTLENGFFVRSNGRYVKVLEPTYVDANGWECTIESDGTIKCACVREYSDGLHSMRYVIQPSGFAKLTLKLPGQKVKLLKKGFVIPKGMKLSDGTLGLAGGRVDERYAYFRDASFQRLLDSWDVSAVKHENPNKTFCLRDARYGGGECCSELLTDGKVTEAEYDFGRTEKWAEENPGTCAYEGNKYLEVSGATWVLHKQAQHERDNHNCFRILYTLEKNLKDLVGIPTIS